jgi:hypothetical protein
LVGAVAALAGAFCACVCPPVLPAVAAAAASPAGSSISGWLVWQYESCSRCSMGVLFGSCPCAI